MKRLLHYLFFSLILSSCLPMDRSTCWGCVNHSSSPVYFIADFVAKDNVITPGSRLKRAAAHDTVTFCFNESLSYLRLRDSLHYYIVDAEKIGLDDPITTEQISRIKEEYILERITRKTKGKRYGCHYPQSCDPYD